MEHCIYRKNRAVENWACDPLSKSCCRREESGVWMAGANGYQIYKFGKILMCPNINLNRKNWINLNMITFNIHVLSYAFRLPWDLSKEKFTRHKYIVIPSGENICRRIIIPIGSITKNCKFTTWGSPRIWNYELIKTQEKVTSYTKNINLQIFNVRHFIEEKLRILCIHD